HICQSWRATTIGTRKLWSSVIVDWHMSASLLTLFMNRSDGSNLSIKIENPVASNLQKSISTITRHSSQVTSLELEIGFYEDQGEIKKSLTNVTFQSLETLVVHLEDWIYTDYPDENTADVRRVSLLERLFDVLESSQKKRLHLHIYGGPKTVSTAFAGHAICERLTALNLHINMRTEGGGVRRSEAAQWSLIYAKHSSFPALKQLHYKGFLPFLGSIKVPLLVDATYQWNPPW
ncbi:12847_t:CDS:2, partial [Acaulospora colombiana]